MKKRTIWILIGVVFWALIMAVYFLLPGVFVDGGYVFQQPSAGGGNLSNPPTYGGVGACNLMAEVTSGGKIDVTLPLRCTSNFCEFILTVKFVGDEENPFYISKFEIIQSPILGNNRWYLSAAQFDKFGAIGGSRQPFSNFIVYATNGDGIRDKLIGNNFVLLEDDTAQQNTADKITMSAFSYGRRSKTVKAELYLC